jgi:hypothetical protein
LIKFLDLSNGIASSSIIEIPAPVTETERQQSIILKQRVMGEWSNAGGHFSKNFDDYKLCLRIETPKVQFTTYEQGTNTKI